MKKLNLNDTITSNNDSSTININKQDNNILNNMNINTNTTTDDNNDKKCVHLEGEF